MRRYLASAFWLCCVGLLAVALLVWLHPANRDSSVLNRSWNGLSKASDALDATALLSYAGLREVPLPATVILAPRVPVDEAVLATLDEFTKDGGTLVVLDDFGYGNDVLSRLGIGRLFQGARLLDPLYCYRSGSMPKVEFSYADPAREPGVMVLNDATWLEVDTGVEVWARSSYFSFGDIDGDGVRGGGDRDGPLPVGATVRRGAGWVVAVSDGSLLLNGVVTVGDNVEALRRFSAGDVLIDQLYLPEAQVDRSKDGLDVLATALGAQAGPMVLIVVSCGLAVGYAWYNRGRR